MSWIVTADHTEFDLLKLDQAKVRPVGIAWALSQINRFNGHCVRPYSVAEHSLLVCEIVERELPGPKHVHAHLAALMHDAHEAYCGDLHSPGKEVLGAAWASFEKPLEQLVRTAFGLHTAFGRYGDFLKLADLTALATEKRDLLPHTPRAWACLRSIDPVPWIDLTSRDRREATWEDWRDLWLEKYAELDFARNEFLFGDSRHAPQQASEGGQP